MSKCPNIILWRNFRHMHIWINSGLKSRNICILTLEINKIHIKLIIYTIFKQNQRGCQQISMKKCGAPNDKRH